MVTHYQDDFFLPGRITVETEREFHHQMTNFIMVQQKLRSSKKGVKSFKTKWLKQKIFYTSFGITVAWGIVWP